MSLLHTTCLNQDRYKPLEDKFLNTNNNLNILKKDNHKIIKKLDGANMDIDLTTDKRNIQWDQDKCPWNEAESSNEHKCAVKNISICPYFCGIEYLDNVLCCYPNKNPNERNE